MQPLKFRTLRADEIEVRPARIDKQTGKATMLLYMDSRAATNLLDETVGAMNWEMLFETETATNLTIGRLGIWDEDKGRFVYKSDTGSESNIEAEKGKVSDIYKRCLSRWGVNELYSAPKIEIPDDGYKCSGYKVSQIAYDDKRQITSLTLVNRFGKPVFTFNNGKTETQQAASDKPKTEPKQEQKKPNLSYKAFQQAATRMRAGEDLIAKLEAAYTLTQGQLEELTNIKNNLNK